MHPIERILITGGSGKVGSACCRESTRHPLEVHATYLTSPHAVQGVRFHHVDLTDRMATHALLGELRPTTILHTAALVHEKDPDKLRQANVEATKILTDWCATSEIYFCYISTDQVFDGDKGNYAEEDPVNPVGYYAQTKAEGEAVVRESGVPASIVRIPINYGWTHRGDTFSEWMLSTVHREGSVQLFSDQYRSPIFLDNLAEALLEITRRKLTGTLHVAGADRLTRYALGAAILKALGYPAELAVPAPMSEVAYHGSSCRDCSMDITAARKLLTTDLLGIERGVRLLAAQRKEAEHVGI